MKKLQLFVVIFLISLSICLFANTQAVKAAGSATVSVPTLGPVSPITLGDSVTASVIVGGIGVSPTGTITFQYSTDNGATWNALGANKQLSKGSATSDPYTPNAAGSNYRIRANYSGDAKHNSAIGNAASLTVKKANPTVPAPSVSPNPVVVNNAVAVSVTISGVSGGSTPTGKVTFQVKIGAGSWTTIISDMSLTAGSASTTYVPYTVDSYQFQVVYSGDSNYNGATGSAVSVKVNFPLLDHFVFSSVGTQTAGSVFTITVTAKDVYGNNAAGYGGTPVLTYSAGSISPSTMDAFVSGVGSTSVAVTAAGSGVTITATDGTHTGISNPFTVTIAPTPTPQSTQTQTPTSTPEPTSKPSAPTATPSPTPTPPPSPDLVSKSIPATLSDGSTTYLTIYGNISRSDISNAAITTDQTNAKTTMTLTLIGQSGANSFCNITIPKGAVPYGTPPTTYLNNQIVENQGYIQDANNYYIWYSTYFGTYELSIVFTGKSGSQFWVAALVVVLSIVLVITTIIMPTIRNKN